RLNLIVFSKIGEPLLEDEVRVLIRLAVQMPLCVVSEPASRRIGQAPGTKAREGAVAPDASMPAVGLEHDAAVIGDLVEPCRSHTRIAQHLGADDSADPCVTRRLA